PRNSCRRIPRMKALSLVVLFLAPVLSAQDVRLEKIGTSPVEARLASGSQIRMNLCASGIDLVGSTDEKMRVSYEAERGDVKVSMQVLGHNATLTVTDCPRNNFRVTIEVPKSSDLRVRMFAGELNVRDVVGDKDMELHFGRLNMEVGDVEK